MNRRIVIAAVLALLVGFGLWGLFRGKPEGAAVTPHPEEIQEQRQEPAKQHSRSTPSPAAVQSRTNTTMINGVAVSEAIVQHEQIMRTDPTYDWTRPIDFYGKVVDENGQPVSGASVDYTWSSISELARNGTLTKRSQADESGSFSIHETGKGIGITVSKNGYYTPRSESLRNYEYADPANGLFTPDPANPVVFHLRSKGEAAQLIHGSKLFGSRIDGTLSYVDLGIAKAMLTPAGDLTIQCTRSQRDSEKRFDWTFTLGALGGGLIESTNEFMFLAPENGYQPTFQINHKIKDPDWVLQEKHSFFLKSQDGQHYARIEITIMPDYNQNAAYDLEWFMNPAGSRNLESSPERTTNVQ